MSDKLSSWSISETNFPRHLKSQDQLKFIIGYAVLAPSTLNTQPWKFKVADEKISVFADKSRRLPVIDPQDRELIISCGAAIANIEAALTNFGMTYRLNFFPNPKDENHLMDIVILGKKIVRDIDKKLFKSILLRRTNRFPFEEKELDGLVLQRLTNIVSEEKVKLHLIKHYRTLLTKIINRGDKIQSGNQEFCNELSQWVHPERVENPDGIPGYAFGAGDMLSDSGPFYIGNLNTGNLQAARDRNLIKGSPALLMIETKTNTVKDWLRTGIAMEKMLLLATSEKLSASYLNQPLEVSDLYQEIITRMNLKGFPQIILRVGYGKEVKPTPRRSVEEVLI